MAKAQTLNPGGRGLSDAYRVRNSTHLVWTAASYR